MSRRPFYKRYPQDRLMATRALSLEERAAYDDCLDLMYSYERPILDEPKWIAGFIGISVRKWTDLRARLIAAGKLTQRGDYLTNERFEREIAYKEADHLAHAEWGRKGGTTRAAREKAAREAAQPSLDLAGIGAPDELSPAKSARKPHENAAKTNRECVETETKPNEINGSGQARLKHARADHIPESREESYDSSGIVSETDEPPQAAEPPERTGTGAGRRLPEGWEPEPLTEPVTNLVAKWPPGMLQHELDKFRDHWLASAGARARKTDWQATWRNWIRKADDDWKRQSARDNGRRGGAFSYAFDR